MNDASKEVPSELSRLHESRGSALEPKMRAKLGEWLSLAHYQSERPALRAAVEAAVNDDSAWADLCDAFRQLLPIGTGGRRGKVAPGPNRVNTVTLRETVFGLHCTMNALGWASRVIVGYDTRCDSRKFAHLAANMLLALGREVSLLDAPRATPQIAFWQRQLGAGAGIVISASHNPPGDNGIKIYGPDGAQVFGARDQALSQAILERGPNAPHCESELSFDHPRLTQMDIEDCDRGYLQEILDQGLCPTLNLRDVGPVVYTALQGVGYPILSRLLTQRGVELHSVTEQCDGGDGRFSKTRATNPEDPRAFDAAIALAKSRGAKVILANDPDADRLGVCLWSDRSQRFEVLDGNDVSALLAWHVCTHAASGSKSLVVSTLVTTSLVAKIAQDKGFFAVPDLLVGFKNHAAYVERNPDLELAFGCEESLGYIRGRNIRDKDGAIAALLVCELLASLSQRNETWEQRRDALWCEYGVHLQHTENLRFEGQAGALTMQRVMQRWRVSPPTSLGGFESLSWEDRSLPRVHAQGDPVRGALSNLLVGEFSRGPTRVRVVLRPSGTEPKLKLYLLCRTAPCQKTELTSVVERVSREQQELLAQAKAQVLAST